MASKDFVKNRLDFLEHRTTSFMNMIDAMCRSMRRDFKIMEKDGEKFIVWEEVKNED